MAQNVLATLPYSTAISIYDLLITLLVGFLIGLGIALVYRFTHRGLTYERSFLVTLVLMGPIISVVIMLIGSNIALSLGLVGALSIIRFRNVIKDSRDMVFLFWTIAVGLGSGTYNWQVVIIASLFIGSVLFLLYYLNYGKTRHSDCVLVLKGAKERPVDFIVESVEKYAREASVRSIEMEDDGWEMVMELRFLGTRFRDQDAMLSSLRQSEHIQHASLMTPRVTLPL